MIRVSVKVMVRVMAGVLSGEEALLERPGAAPPPASRSPPATARPRDSHRPHTDPHGTAIRRARPRPASPSRLFPTAPHPAPTYPQPQPARMALQAAAGAVPPGRSLSALLSPYGIVYSSHYTLLYGRPLFVCRADANVAALVTSGCDAGGPLLLAAAEVA